MRILVIGSGAREHALVRALSRDENVTGIHAAPGNPGIALSATCHDVDQQDSGAVVDLARQIDADLVAIGPEAPLVAGLADTLREAGIACFGPTAAAARLEGSKTFAKKIMRAAGVPTAEARSCRTVAEAARALEEFGAPHVVKADGLAAGKGVVVTSDRTAATAHAQACLAQPDSTVVIEEFLDGPEVSLFCISDGTSVVPLVPAQDFKRALDNDAGPNTGGMGAYTPLPWAPPDLAAEVVRDVAQPTIDEMARRGTPFAGVLYCGLALTSKGMRVVEFNARFGDPETQVVLERLETPLGSLLLASAQGSLAELAELQWSADAAVTVVIAAHGYPGTVRGGDPVVGIEAAQDAGCAVLHAGTAATDGRLVSAGGRVLSVVGVGGDLQSAREQTYRGVAEITLRGSQHRTDIARAASEPGAAESAGEPSPDAVSTRAATPAPSSGASPAVEFEAPAADER